MVKCMNKIKCYGSIANSHAASIMELVTISTAVTIGGLTATMLKRKFPKMLLA